MILELADIRIQPGKNAEFEVAIEHGVKTIIAQAQGFQGWKVNRCIETPERYVLQIFLGDAGGPHRAFPQRSVIPPVAWHRRPFFRRPTPSRAL